MKSPRHLWSGDWQSESRQDDRLATPVADSRAPEEPTAETDATVRPRRRRSKWLAIGAAVAVLALGGTYAAVDLIGGESSNSPTALPAVAGAAIKPQAGQTQAGAIYAKASPAVVSVRTTEGSGTGFLVDSDGTIVTNSHVVASASSVTIRFGDDGAAIRGEVVGSDPSSDLAIVKIEGSAIPAGVSPLKFADSNRVAVGDTVLAIGNPFGLDRTQTAGIVSGVGRDIQAPNGFQISDAIQTDAAINPGNSGGPLLDSAGLVVGVNSQIETSGMSSGNVGIGFAVPSNTVRQVVPVLKQGRTIERAWLGVSSSDPATGQGAQISDITANSPAAKAGLRQGDVITAIGSKPVTSSATLSSLVAEAEAGDKVKIKVQRGGATIELTAELSPRPTNAP